MVAMMWNPEGFSKILLFVNAIFSKKHDKNGMMDLHVCTYLNKFSFSNLVAVCCDTFIISVWKFFCPFFFPACLLD